MNNLLAFLGKLQLGFIVDDIAFNQQTAWVEQNIVWLGFQIESLLGLCLCNVDTLKLDPFVAKCFSWVFLIKPNLNPFV